MKPTVEYVIESFDQDESDNWFATIILLENDVPAFVYRVQSDPPVKPQVKKG
jgi:hypothetical protein